MAFKLRYPSTGIVIPPAAHTSLLSQTFEGSPGGMNLAVPQHEIPDTQARYIQDCLVDIPGFTRRRGPVKAVSTVPALAVKASGLATTLNPVGNARFAALSGNHTQGFFSVLDDSATSWVNSGTSITWPFPLPVDPATPGDSFCITDIKPALNGGLLIGTSSSYGSNAPNQGLAFWRGGNRADTSTGTITVARGSASVTGSGTSWATTLSPGMFMFATTDFGVTNAYLGVVLAVNSNTSITLEAVSRYTCTAKACSFKSIRGIAPNVVKGRITCDTSSATVTGGATEFSSQGLGSGSWNIYRQSDQALVGTVLTVISDTSLTLTGNASVACSDEGFVAVKSDADFNIVNTGANKVGFLTAIYAGRQWYANRGSTMAETQRVWFSDSSDLEGLDLSTFNGDWLDVASTTTTTSPITALIPTQNALLVLKENEAFVISGTSPSQFSVRKVADDGAFSNMSVQAWNGGAIWAGRSGIFYFDGLNVTNLVQDNLGNYWKDLVRTFDPTVYRMYAMMTRNHYFLFIEHFTAPLPVVKGNVSTFPTSYTIAMNLNSFAITLLTNMPIRGSVVPPASTGNRLWYIVNDNLGFSHICDGDALFNAEGNDDFGSGPDFFYESKKFNAGDSLRLKRFKQLSINYLAEGTATISRSATDYLNIDSVIGLNNFGQTLVSTFSTTYPTWDRTASNFKSWSALGNQFATWNDCAASIFIVKRVKFQKKTQHLSFRIYQPSSKIGSVNSGLTKVRLAPFQIVFKLARVGRV